MRLVTRMMRTTIEAVVVLLEVVRGEGEVRGIEKEKGEEPLRISGRGIDNGKRGEEVGVEMPVEM